MSASNLAGTYVAMPKAASKCAPSASLLGGEWERLLPCAPALANTVSFLIFTGSMCPG